MSDKDKGHLRRRARPGNAILLPIDNLLGQTAAPDGKRPRITPSAPEQPKLREPSRRVAEKAGAAQRAIEANAANASGGSSDGTCCMFFRSLLLSLF